MTRLSDPIREGELPLRGVSWPLAGLYAIVDVTSVTRAKLDPVEFARRVLAAYPAALQVRAKELEARELLALLRAIGAHCHAAGVPLVVNDRVDLAVLAGADFVHVGQDDLPVDRVRRVAPGLRVGISTHTETQLTEALQRRPDYVAYGPVFPTTSKENPDPSVGLDGLERAARLAAIARIPLVAIGGITLDRASDVGRVAPAAAIIHALLPHAEEGRYKEVTARAQALHRALGGAGAADTLPPS